MCVGGCECVCGYVHRGRACGIPDATSWDSLLDGRVALSRISASDDSGDTKPAAAVLLDDADSPIPLLPLLDTAVVTTTGVDSGGGGRSAEGGNTYATGVVVLLVTPGGRGVTAVRAPVGVPARPPGGVGGRGLCSRNIGDACPISAGRNGNSRSHVKLCGVVGPTSTANSSSSSSSSSPLQLLPPPPCTHRGPKRTPPTPAH